MKFRTHVITAVAIGAAAIQFEVLPKPVFFSDGLELIDFFIALLIVGVGGLLPDIDHNRSFISNKLGFNLSWLFKHRGPTHTVYPYIAMIVFGLYETTLLAESLFWLGIGSLLHMYGDMHTVSGVRIFGWGPALRVLPKPIAWSYGSGVESIFMFLYSSLLIFSIGDIFNLWNDLYKFI
jgi:membrane-bound metal-dependent hydrolase YbcI (DUF457 family)